MIFSLSPKHLVVFLIASLSLLSQPPVSTAQLEIKNLLNKLDSHYYYPQKKGLTRISAKLTWEQQDTSAKKTFFFKKPDFRFKGQLSDHTFEKKIVSSGRNPNVPDNEKTEYIKILNNYLDAFIPKTLYEQFLNYEGQIKRRQKKEIILELTGKTSTENTKQYELFIDVEKWRISKIHIRQNPEPKSIEGNFFYTLRGGQWVVVETLSKFTVNDKTYIEKTEYTYKSLQNFWLVNKIKQTVKQDDHLIRSYRIQLNDYKVNLEN
jgi:tRNA nucleotidyltransferase (CCA-adding enzyme)